LPFEKNAKHLDIAIIGVFLEIGTVNRNGTQFAPPEKSQ
jgi:arginase family enzyme